jgi:peptidoglycan/LPS O-acetylase OafA/YrhL
LDRHLTPAVTIPKGRIFHTLDALRGIAAICVLMFHMGGAFTPLAAPGGYLAVDLFFMMSGVVLANAYEARFAAGMGTLDFMRARLIRLYPLYLVGTLLGVLLTLASLHGRNSQNWDPASLAQAAALALFFLPNFAARPVNALFPLNIPCWSLFFEILVNLLYVVFWPLLRSPRLLLVALVTGAVVGWACAHGGSLDQGSNAPGFGIGLARTVFGFCVGILIARHIPGHRGQNNLGVVLIVAVAGIAIAGWPRHESRALWDAVCVLVVFPSIVYFGALIDPGLRLRRIATFLGATSYALYLLHSPLASISSSATRFFNRGTGAPYSGLAVLGFLLAGCWLIDRYYDMPIRRELSRIIPRNQTRQAHDS